MKFGLTILHILLASITSFSRNSHYARPLPLDLHDGSGLAAPIDIRLISASAVLAVSLLWPLLTLLTLLGLTFLALHLRLLPLHLWPLETLLRLLSLCLTFPTLDLGLLPLDLRSLETRLLALNLLRTFNPRLLTLSLTLRLLSLHLRHLPLSLLTLRLLHLPALSLLSLWWRLTLNLRLSATAASPVAAASAAALTLR